jgi:hypothetical protein
MNIEGISYYHPATQKQIDDLLDEVNEWYGKKITTLLEILLQQDNQVRPTFQYLLKKNFAKGGLMEDENFPKIRYSYNNNTTEVYYYVYAFSHLYRKKRRKIQNFLLNISL